MVKSTKSKPKRAAKRASQSQKKHKSQARTLTNVTGDVQKVPHNIKMSRDTHVAMGRKQTVCGLTDPFCRHAIGARIPDGTPNTFTASGRGFFTMATGATGGVSLAVMNPCAPYGYLNIQPTTLPYTVSNCTWWQNLGGPSLFATYADRMRIVSAGFILRAIQNASSAQGMFVIQTQQSVPFDGSVTVGGDFLGNDNETVSNYPGMEYSYIWRPNNQTLAKQFTSTSTNSSNSELAGWPSAVVYFSGGVTTAAANIAIIEYFINVEFTVKPESGLNPLSGKPTPADPHVVAMREAAHSAMPVSIKGGVADVGKALENVVSEVAKGPVGIAADVFSALSHIKI